MPADGSLSASLPPLEQICSAAFWRGFAPELQIGGSGTPTPTVTRQAFELLQRRMQREGYFGDSDEQLLGLAPRIGQAVKRCADRGMPPVFAWVFDEPWECFRLLAPVISRFLGADYKILPAFWAWHIDPGKNERGWTPHRDNSRSLAADGAPTTLTCWIPLSEASPMNSCMYILPAHLDPYYGKPTTPQSQLPDLSLARAAPAAPGDYLIWNQAVLHWGSASSEFAETARMSMALEFQRGDIPAVRAPLLDPHILPTFEARLRLIAIQVLQYTHMYGYSAQLVRLAQDLRTAPINAA
jgi:hypothetical protein